MSRYRPQGLTKERRWCRLSTSQWHLLHSIRVGADQQEFMLTVDGEYLPTERRKWNYGAKEQRPLESTGAKVFEGVAPKGRICSRCYAFATFEERTVEVG